VKKHAKEEYDQANAHKLVKKQVVWCGSGVGLIHSIEHAEDLVNNLVKETVLLCQRNSAFAENT
jgi:NAD(P)H-dependent flavin oxidoreductase YrpB (nitropropane dioxygenase family)